MSVVPFLLALALSSATSGERLPVSEDEILEAMQRTQGFDPTATMNGGRFQAEVLLRLARDAQIRDPQGPPLYLPPGRRDLVALEARLKRPLKLSYRPLDPDPRDR